MVAYVKYLVRLDLTIVSEEIKCDSKSYSLETLIYFISMLRFLAESLKAMTEHSRLCHDAIQYQVPHTSSFKGAGIDLVNVCQETASKNISKLSP